MLLDCAIQLHFNLLFVNIQQQIFASICGKHILSCHTNRQVQQDIVTIKVFSGELSTVKIQETKRFPKTSFKYASKKDTECYSKMHYSAELMTSDDFVWAWPCKILCLSTFTRLAWSRKQKTTTSFLHLLTFPKRFKAPVCSPSLFLFSLSYWKWARVHHDTSCMKSSWASVPQGGFSSIATTLLAQESVCQTLLHDLEMA